MSTVFATTAATAAVCSDKWGCHRAQNGFRWASCLDWPWRLSENSGDDCHKADNNNIHGLFEAVAGSNRSRVHVWRAAAGCFPGNAAWPWVEISMSIAGNSCIYKSLIVISGTWWELVALPKKKAQMPEGRGCVPSWSCQRSNGV